MKKGIAFLLALSLLTTSLIVLVLPVRAVSKTIIVPDDYPTISSAVGNAINGDTILVRKGTYEETTITIEKSISIIGEDVNKTTIKLHPPVYNVTWILTQSYAALSNAITINADDFTLSNLTLTLSPDGYIAATGDRLQITGNNISGTGTVTGLIINGSYCDITGNILSGLDHFDFNQNTYVTSTIAGGFISINGSSNIVARNLLSKILVTGNSNSADNNTITGIQLSDSCQNLVSKNQILSSTGDYGIRIVGNSSNNVIHDNNVQALSYDVEINSMSAENNTFYHNNFILKYSNKLVGLFTYNSTLVNFWDNGREGNYWEGYNGTDANGDGIGDAPYVIDAGNMDQYPLMNPWTKSEPQLGLAQLQIWLIVITIVVLAVMVAVLAVYFKRNKR